MKYFFVILSFLLCQTVFSKTLAIKLSEFEYLKTQATEETKEFVLGNGTAVCQRKQSDIGCRFYDKDGNSIGKENSNKAIPLSFIDIVINSLRIIMNEEDLSGSSNIEDMGLFLKTIVLAKMSGHGELSENGDWYILLEDLDKNTNI